MSNKTSNLCEWFVNRLAYLGKKLKGKHSMQEKPLWQKVEILKNLRWDRLSMSKIFILNLSLWANFMIGYFYHNRILVITDEIRKSQKADTLITPLDIFNISKTKGALRTKIQQYNATWGLPKCREVYGDGDPIVSDSILNYGNTTKVMFSEWKVDQLDKEDKVNLLLKKGLPENTKIINIYKNICNIHNLIFAYDLVSKKKGANTLGIDNISLDSYSKETVNELSKSLKDHSFKFKPIRRVEIPKPNGGKRLLSIAGPRDKVVLKAASNELEKIYENIFKDTSHGFRPNRGTHTALKQISKWNNIKWFVEGDIKKYFDTINYHKLIEILKEEINDKEFIDFIWKAIKVEYVTVLEKKIEYSEIGTPQGGTLSPILSNIYLHKLDKFMEQIVEESKKTGPTSIDNPEYKKIHTKISNDRQIFSKTYRYTKDSKLKTKARLSGILSLEKKRAVLKSKITNKGSFRIYYVRYADDFLIGVNGTKSKANEIKEQIKNFIKEELLLELNIEKTKITSAIKSRALFLGSQIRISKSRTQDQKRRINSYKNNGRKIRARNPIGYILMLAPIEKITKRLAEQGICKIKNFSKREVIPCSKTAWVNLESHSIINKYNEIWRGILNYYSFAYNRCQLNFIQYLIQHSAACTLMNKLKISSRAKIFKKFGSELTINIPNSKKSISLYIQKNLKRINKYNIKVNLPYDKFNYNLRTIGNNLLLQPCVICKSINNVEMHHRKHLRNKKTDNILKGIKVNLSRKQIPLCKDCHRNVHNGTYDGPGIY